jgi:tryptophanyl-tRNA synthetase
MNKSHAYKACVEKNLADNKPADDGVNMGLYTYPTLMAADILSMDTDIVPVGKDQIQHVEIARDIACAVNAYFGKELLKLPQYVTQDNVAVLPGIDGRKMSKSYNNVIPLFEDDKIVKKAVYATVTDSKPIEEPKNPDDVIVYQIYKCLAKPEQIAEMADGLKNGKLGYGHIKAMLLDAILTETKDAKETYDYYLAHYDEVIGFLHDGAAKARPYAQATLKRLKETLFG